MVSDAQDGDAVRETIDSGYRAVGGIKVPSGRIVRVNGDVLEGVKYTDVRFNTRPPETSFTRPKGYRVEPTEGGGPDGKYTPSTIDDTALHFHDAMKRLGLQVERIAGVHSPVTSMKEFRKAVKRRRRAK